MSHSVYMFHIDSTNQTNGSIYLRLMPSFETHRRQSSYPSQASCCLLHLKCVCLLLFFLRLNKCSFLIKKMKKSFRKNEDNWVGQLRRLSSSFLPLIQLMCLNRPNYARGLCLGWKNDGKIIIQNTQRFLVNRIGCPCRRFFARVILLSYLLSHCLSSHNKQVITN